MDRLDAESVLQSWWKVPEQSPARTALLSLATALSEIPRLLERVSLSVTAELLGEEVGVRQYRWNIVVAGE